MITHACPPEGSGLTPCCQLPPLELPRDDRMSLIPEDVDCSPRPTVGGVPLPDASAGPDEYLARCIAYHEQQLVALHRLAALLDVELPLGARVWRPWRLELLPGVYQSVMLPQGATIGHVSAGPGALNVHGSSGILLWLEVPLVTDPASAPTHRYVVVLPADAHPPLPLADGGWLGDCLVYGHGTEPWDGTVFRCYEVEA